MAIEACPGNSWTTRVSTPLRRSKVRYCVSQHVQLEPPPNRIGEMRRRWRRLCLAIDEAEAEDSTFDASMARLWSLPDGAAFQPALAIDCYRDGLYLDAIVYAIRSVLIPNSVLSIFVLGRSYLAARMYEDAKISFVRVLKLQPDFAIARSGLNSVPRNCFNFSTYRHAINAMD